MAEKTPAEIAGMILQVDGTRQADDPFKLPAALRQVVVSRLAAYNADLAIQNDAGGNQTSAQDRYRNALNSLKLLERDVYNAIRGKPSFDMSAADKKSWLVRLGFAGGEIGRPDDALLKTRAETILANAPVGTGEEGEVLLISQAILDRITAQSAIVEANESLAGGGQRKIETGDKDDSLKLLGKAVSRVRHHYCAASDDVDTTPELDRIGWQARRAPGTVEDTEPTTPNTPNNTP